MGLPVITLYKVWAYLSGNFGVASESQTLPRGPFHPEVSVIAPGDMKSALPGLYGSRYQLLETVSERPWQWHLTSRRNLGHLMARMAHRSASAARKLPTNDRVSATGATRNAP